jgi:hypothetical protein
MRFSKRTKVAVGVLTLAAAGTAVDASVVFAEDFTGTSPWGFDTLDGDTSQIGGVNQFEFTVDPGAGAGSLTAELPNVASTVTTDEEGIVTVSGTIDMTDLDLLGNFNSRNFLEVTGEQGNKSALVANDGILLNLGLTGFNNSREFRFSQGGALRFWNGGGANSGTITDADLGPEGLLFFTTVLTISEPTPDDWVYDIETTLTSNGTLNEVLTSSWGRGDGTFTGIQYIDGLRVGFDPLGPDTAADVFVLDDLSMSITAIPEPASAGLLALAGLATLRRRR